MRIARQSEADLGGASLEKEERTATSSARLPANSKLDGTAFAVYSFRSEVHGIGFRVKDAECGVSGEGKKRGV